MTTEKPPAGEGSAGGRGEEQLQSSSAGRTALALHVPVIDPDDDALSAALAYARSGWYVVPIRRGSKHPGSVLGDGWQHQSSNNPAVIASWFAGTDHGVALHVGRSGAVVLDVDDPEQLPEFIVTEISSTSPPCQSTRTNVDGKGHYIFACPEGRQVGNGNGQLGRGWGEVRGRNGIIVVSPSIHPAAADGGRYQWLQTGEVPVLPVALADKLPETGDTVDAATDAELQAFIERHAEARMENLMSAVLHHFQQQVDAGGSRHDAAVTATCWAMRDAKAGAYPAKTALLQLRNAFVEAMGIRRNGSDRALPETFAVAEFRGIASWAVAQAGQKDRDQLIGEIRERVSEYPMEAIDRSGDDHELQPPNRRLVFEPATSITPRPVLWAWDTASGADPAQREGRFPIGSLCLAVGRAGLGKSQFAVWKTAQITNGTLPGAYYGTPRSVVYAATEDSWEMTIGPRLIAAGADLSRVYRVKVQDDGDLHARLTLPSDTRLLEQGIVQHDVALVVLDPLLSMVDHGINDYRAREVREALEPLVAVADRTRAMLLGLAHFTKATGSDPLLLISGSGAFGQLIRAAVGFAKDDDAEEESQPSYVLSQIKNNLGREDLPSLGYQLAPVSVDTPEGDAWVSRLEFTGVEPERSVRDLLRTTNVDPEERAERNEVAEWIKKYLGENSGEASSRDVIKAAIAELGVSRATITRARYKAGVKSRKDGMEGGWIWSIDPNAPSEGFTKKPKDPAHTGMNSSDSSVNSSEGEPGAVSATQPDSGNGSASPPGVNATADPEPPPDEPDHRQSTWARPQCRGCGQPLLLVRPGREQCDACRLSNTRAAS